MTYGDRDETRKLAGNPKITDVTDAQIDTFLLAGDEYVNRCSGKSDWGTNPLAKEAAEYYTASRTLSRYGANTKKAQEFLAIAQKICDLLRATSEEGLITVFQDYATSPLNPDAPIYRSNPQGL